MIQTAFHMFQRGGWSKLPFICFRGVAQAPTRYVVRVSPLRLPVPTADWELTMGSAVSFSGNDGIHCEDGVWSDGTHIGSLGIKLANGKIIHLNGYQWYQWWIVQETKFDFRKLTLQQNDSSLTIDSSWSPVVRWWGNGNTWIQRNQVAHHVHITLNYRSQNKIIQHPKIPFGIW